MNSHIIFLFGIIFFTTSCINKTASNGDNAFLNEIDLNKNDQISINDYFAEIEVIPLETNDNSLLPFLIGEPDKVIKSNDKFYFLNRKEAVIVVFNLHGKFLNRINWKGKGPNEYFQINDFIINRFNGNIEILSPENNAIYCYDSLGEKFIEKISLPFEMPIIHHFEAASKDTYILYSLAGNATLNFYSKLNKQIIKTNYDLPEWFCRNSTFTPVSRSPFYVYNDSLFFNQIYNGNVYNININESNLKLRYSWDFGEYNFNISDLPTDKPFEYYLDLNKKISNKYAVLFQVYSENSNYFFSRFKFKNRYKHLVYDKKNKKYSLFEKYIEGLQCIPQWIDEQAIYTFTTKDYLRFVINDDVLSDRNRQTINNISNEDNPVIIIFKFKKQ